MTTHRITYEGPSSLAVQTATLLADAEGVELTSSTRMSDRVPEDGQVVLALTADGPADAVEAAVASIQEGLPPGATIRLE